MLLLYTLLHSLKICKVLVCSKISVYGIAVYCIQVECLPYSSLLVYCYLMFDLTFTFSFLLILKTRFYHSPKWYRPQPLVNERTLSNNPLFNTRNYTLHYLLINFAANSKKFATFLKLSNC